MKHLPTIKQLRYFLALAEHAHFGRAAEACFVSQSAFSAAIKELETLLGARLVDRTNKQVTITAIGGEVAIQARLVLRDLEALTDLVSGDQSPLSGRLKLGVIPTIAPFLLPKVLNPLRKSYPALQLYLVEDQTLRIHERLMAGELDLLLIGLPYELRGVSVLPLFRDKFHLAYRKGTQRIDPEHFRVNRLNAESVLLLEDGHCLREHTIDACRLKDLNKIAQFSASSLFTLVQMVNEDLGITFLPEMALKSSLLTSTQIETQPMAKTSFREIGLAWRKGSRREDEFKMLGEFICARAKPAAPKKER